MTHLDDKQKRLVIIGAVAIVLIVVAAFAIKSNKPDMPRAGDLASSPQIEGLKETEAPDRMRFDQMP